MGQSATLCRVTQTNFEKIADDLSNVRVASIAESYVTFEQTFEGIRFVLSKGQSEANVSLINQIFYPAQYIGKEIDLSDLENIPDDFDFENPAIYYNAPNSVADICTLLSTITPEEFEKLFDANELNKNDVYPKIWSNDPDPDGGFNAINLTQEFASLKEFMSIAKSENNYVFSFMG